MGGVGRDSYCMYLEFVGFRVYIMNVTQSLLSLVSPFSFSSVAVSYSKTSEVLLSSNLNKLRKKKE